MSITTGAAPLAVTSLGRMVVQGNTGTHTLKIVDGSTGTDVPGSSVNVDTSSGTPGGFSYSALQNLIVLNPNSNYYIVSSESSTGDLFYDSTTLVQTTSGAT